MLLNCKRHKHECVHNGKGRKDNQAGFPGRGLSPTGSPSPLATRWASSQDLTGVMRKWLSSPNPTGRSLKDCPTCGHQGTTSDLRNL